MQRTLKGCIRKTQFSTCVSSFTAHTEHFTSDHQMCGGFLPYQAILCDTSWVSYSSVQSQYYLPGDWFDNLLVQLIDFRGTLSIYIHNNNLTVGI